MKRSEDSLYKLWETKIMNIHIIGLIPRGRERKRGRKLI